MKNRRAEDAITFTLRHSPLGWLGAAAGRMGVAAIVLHRDAEEVRRRILEACPGAVEQESELTLAALGQLEEFFRGERRRFDLPLDLAGLPPFTARVLQRLQELPFGERITYGGLAAIVGRPAAARAVGRAMASNPLPIIVPCHRVLGAGGRMTGYSGGEGIATKLWLLEFEQECMKR